MIKNIVEKIKILSRRRNNARKLKLKFSRAATWTMPEKVFINDKYVDLHFATPGNSDSVFIDIMLSDTYELNLIKSKLKKVSNILDIGANQGLFILYARSVFPEAKIHSYEPNALLIKSLEHHSSFAKSNFFMEAVGLENGRINLYCEDGNNLTTVTILDEEGTVPQVSIKESIARMGGTIDLLKLDCEGAEWDILKDVESLKNARAITLEYHLIENRNHGSIKEVLKAANFKVLSCEKAGPTWGMALAINNLAYN
jgi:FkbM family methyltransferase